MDSEQYRAYLAESIKTGAKMMHDMAEDITALLLGATRK